MSSSRTQRFIALRSMNMLRIESCSFLVQENRAHTVGHRPLIATVNQCGVCLFGSLEECTTLLDRLGFATESRKRASTSRIECPN